MFFFTKIKSERLPILALRMIREMPILRGCQSLTALPQGWDFDLGAGGMKHTISQSGLYNLGLNFGSGT